MWLAKTYLLANRRLLSYVILAAEADGFEVCEALYDKHTMLLAAPVVRDMHILT